MLNLNHIQYTRQELNELYKYEQIKIRSQSILKITDHLRESVFKKASQGGTNFTEYFPKNKFVDLQNEVIIKIKILFPDSEIYVKEMFVDGTNAIAVTINWGLTDV